MSLFEGTPFIINILLMIIIVILLIRIFLLSRHKKLAVDKKEKVTESYQRSRAKYQDLFENANDAIFILDSEHNYLDVNKKGVEMFGYAREELLTMNVKDLIPPEQFARSDEEFSQLQKDGHYEQFVGRVQARDGRIVAVEVNSSAIVEDGKVVGSRDIVRDITERIKAEEEKERIIQKLQKALDEIKTLKGIVPICSFCKKVRDDKGYWEQVDVYIKEHSEADISHSICPDCMREHYPDHKIG